MSCPNPAPLPAQRKPALPLSVSTVRATIPAKKLWSTHSQDETALLTRLPFEVRSLIYKEVLGGEVFHILRDRKKPGLYQLSLRQGLCPDCLCLGRTFSQGMRPGWKSSGEPLDESLLSLLKTCRKK